MRLVILLLCGLWLSQGVASASSLLGSRVGASREAGVFAAAAGYSNSFMAANDAGYDARFVADSTLDVLAITVNWITVTAAGVVSIRIETDDGTGKPSGTLYDANATLTLQVPAVGVKTYTFVTPPTTTLTIGALYHVLIITTTLGTTMNLGGYITVVNPTLYPTTVLSTATATTRNTFAVVANAVPGIMLTRTGGIFKSFEVMALPFSNTLTSSNIFTTNAVAAKIVTQATLSVTGYVIDNMNLTGVAAGDLRIRLFDSSDAVVSGSTATVDKDIFLTTKGIKVPLGTPISIVASTYRIVLDSASSADNTHCYTMKSPTGMDVTAIPNSTLSVIADVTASPPLSWTDTNTVQVPAALLIDGITLPAVIKGAGGIIGG